MTLEFLMSLLTRAAVFGLIALPVPMILGMLWYGPLFGKPWMRAIGKTEDELTMGGGLIAGTAIMWLVSCFVSAIGVGIFISSEIPKNMIEFGSGGTALIFMLVLVTLVFLGYCLNHIVMAKNYQGQTFSLAWIDAGYQYVCYMGIAIIQFFLYTSGWLQG